MPEPVVPVQAMPRRRPVLRQGSSMSSIDADEVQQPPARRAPPMLRQDSSSTSCIPPPFDDEAADEDEPLLPSATHAGGGIDVLQRRWRVARRRGQESARAMARRPRGGGDGSDDEGPWWDGLVSLCACCVIMGIAVAWLLGSFGAIFYGLSTHRKPPCLAKPVVSFASLAHRSYHCYGATLHSVLEECDTRPGDGRVPPHARQKPGAAGGGHHD